MIKQNGISLIFLMILALGACASSGPAVIQSLHTGSIQASELLQNYPAFKDEYQAYSASQAELLAIKKLAGKSVLVLFGTWCHDSEREVPRLLRLLEQSQVKLAELRLVAVNYNKQDPEGLHRQYNLQYTPTFILLDAQRELGRVVEKPAQSLAQDLAGLLR